MLAESILMLIVLIALIVGSYTDFKTREVPDWLNYSLIFMGLGLRLIFSMVYWDLDFIIEGMLGFGAFFIIAVVMFYAGQWGGGDSKMVMGLGALIGLELSMTSFLIAFIINIVIFGAVFGMLFSVYLAISHWTEFVSEFKKAFSQRKRMKWIIWAATISPLALTLFVPFTVKVPLVVLGGMIFISFYAFIYLKAVEGSCMIKWVDPKDLTEGDWVVNDVLVDKKRICGPKDLGLEMAQIRKLRALKKKGKIKKILIKYGIPFVPSFLLAFIATYLWGNIIFSILSL